MNERAAAVARRVIDAADDLGVHVERLSCGAQVLDFGVQAPGGLGAGLELAA
ncbi:MAG: methenyltetrahydromethanopterin cyclohydrolase, partial [Planctomycetota bacterium]